MNKVSKKLIYELKLDLFWNSKTYNIKYPEYLMEVRHLHSDVPRLASRVANYWWYYCWHCEIRDCSEGVLKFHPDFDTFLGMVEFHSLSFLSLFKSSSKEKVINLIKYWFQFTRTFSLPKNHSLHPLKSSNSHFPPQ